MTCDLVGKELGLSQRTLSAWESGKQQPDKRRAGKLHLLADVLKIDRKELEKALDLQSESIGKVPQGLTKPELFDDAQNFVEKVGADKLDLWFFGAQNLPVLDNAIIHKDKKVEDYWKQNLSNGSNYNIVWFLDQINSNIFDQLSLKIENISNEILNNKNAGIISNYALILITDERSLAVSSIIDDYERICSNKNNSARWIRPFITDSRKLQSIRNEIFVHWGGRASSIILYSTRMRANKIPSRATLHLKEFYSIYGLEIVSPFLWYKEKDAIEIELIARAIQSLQVDN